MKRIGQYLILFACLAAGTARSEDLQVGVMTHLGGDFAAWGQAYLEGITLARQRANQSGGVGGHEISLIIEDTRFDSALTASASHKLLDLDRVPVAMVSTFTEAMVAGPLFQKAEVPLLVFADAGGSIESLGKFVFSTGAWVDGFGVSASEFLRKQLGISSVAIISTNNAWSQSTATRFREDFESRGGTVTLSFELNPSESDFRAVLNKLRASKVSAIFAPITSNSAAFFEQARQLKVEMPIVTAGGALDSDVIKAVPAAVEGRYVTNAFLDDSRPQAKEFLNLYREEFGRAPPYPSATARGYDGFMALVHAMKAAKSLSPEDIRESLSHVNFEAAGFKLEIDSKGTARLPVRVLKVKNGRLLPVDDN